MNYILEYMFKGLYTYLKGANHCLLVYIEDIYVYFIATERTPPQTNSLVFKLE